VAPEIGPLPETTPGTPDTDQPLRLIRLARFRRIWDFAPGQKPWLFPREIRMGTEQAKRTADLPLSRSDVRERKRILRIGMRPNASEQERAIAKKSAVVLLERSIQQGHRRLALQRLVDAVRVGATLSSYHWKYCEAVAQDFDPVALQHIIGSSADSTSR